MKSVFRILSVLIVLSIVSCGDDDPATSDLRFAISGLEDLGSGFAYEGWIIVDGSPVSTGVFTVDGSGQLSSTSFSLTESQLNSASTFVLTIEPSPDNDPAPSDVHILAGDFSGNSATLSIAHGAALGNSFATSSGDYILATPTNGSDNNEKSGIWFLDISSGSPMQGLDLPSLPAGWVYEGWVVMDGIPVTTGTFTSVTEEDSSAPYSGSDPGPPFPGEDFLQSAPAGLNFPTDISGGTAVISIEPVPDNSSAPFTLKPLVGMIPSDADDHVVYPMMQNLNFPMGSVTR